MTAISTSPANPRVFVMKITWQIIYYIRHLHVSQLIQPAISQTRLWAWKCGQHTETYFCIWVWIHEGVFAIGIFTACIIARAAAICLLVTGSANSAVLSALLFYKEHPVNHWLSCHVSFMNSLLDNQGAGQAKHSFESDWSIRLYIPHVEVHSSL